MSNKINIIGNLTADAELRFSKDGLPFANFTVADSKSRLEDGKWVETRDAIFWNCVTFSPDIETSHAELTKGRRVEVSGKLESADYVNKEGKRAPYLKLIVDAIGVYGGRERA